MEGKDGFYEELGDVLQRTLHLGGIYGIVFAPPQQHFQDISSSELEGKIAKLHKITSEAYESYRHKQIEPFKERLIYLAFATLQISHDYEFSLEQAVWNKIEKNKDRKWDKTKMNEQFS